MFGKFFDKIKDGLTKTRNTINDAVTQVLKLAVEIDEDLYEELEEILITSDIGVETSVEIIERLRKKVISERISEPDNILPAMKEIIMEMMGDYETSIVPEHTPEVRLIIGVNGVGKTTSIGKMAARIKESNHKVLLAAADTFRAAAIDQLEIWSKRANVEIIKHQEGSEGSSSNEGFGTTFHDDYIRASAAFVLVMR